MEYRQLGRTGVEVSPLALGTMMFGPWANADVDDSIRIIHRALDAGINFVDTADAYSDGVSEEIVGKAIKGRRDDVVLATKFFMPMGEGPNRSGGSRRWIVQEVENSLRRLGTDLARADSLRDAGSPADGVIARRQIARVLVDALTTQTAVGRTLELVAERGPEQADLGPLSATLDPDTGLEGVRDQENQPLDAEPAVVRQDLAHARG